VIFPPEEVDGILLFEFVSYILYYAVAPTIIGDTGADRLAVITFGDKESSCPLNLAESIRPPDTDDLNVST
jgi:hypothetical protein